ncbi:MAG: dihydroorotate dehydrogenase [Candidatus Thermoplasmatota archaeon]|nr:dihydroorotate dehydrogenase [Candidatus Thermoplasmatota archaeon]
MVKFRSRLFGTEFDPPLILASGILDQTAESIQRLIKKGMGGVVTKSIGTEPREGHPNPTIVELDTGLLNAMGLPNQGIEDFKNEMEKLESELEEEPIIGSIFASDPDDFSHLAGKMTRYGADMVELNLSCPHAEGYGAQIASDDEIMERVIKKVDERIQEPILAKLPPSNEIAKNAVLAERSGADGIVCINTVRAMAVNFETQEPILGNKIGGYSGPGIKPIGLRCVYEVYREVDIPIIGCGGITDGRDALEYILAGASALQMGSALHHRGKDAVEKVSKEATELMRKEGIDDIEEIIGGAH